MGTTDEFEVPCRCKALRMVRDRLFKLLKKEQQRNQDLRKRIAELELRKR